MDPPEESTVTPADLELASLLEETIADGETAINHGDDYGDDSGSYAGAGSSSRDAPSDCDLYPPSLSAFKSSRSRGVLSRGGGGGGGRAALPSPKSGGGCHGGGFSHRLRNALLLLAAFALFLVIVVNKSENAVETDQASTTYEVRHSGDGLLSKFGFGGGSSSKGGGGSNSKKGGSRNTNDGSYIGFHEPSRENLYGANRYYKPPGVGFPLAPRGGLHPIFMLDFSEEDIAAQIAKYDNGTLFDDDPDLSPYADLRLAMSDEERKKEQEGWSKKLEEIRERYGYWNFTDDYASKNKGTDRPRVDWATVGDKKTDYDVRYGEIDKADFPTDSWQTDDVYVSNFISEGKALVKRTIDAISDEYGWDDDTKKGGISIPDAATPEGKVKGGKMAVAWMYDASFTALAKKLLNAMMTNDHFFVTLGGHSAAAGHGNNFWQSYPLEFQRVMEPVFDRLGMVLVSANRAQGGMGTLQAALAGKGIFGENDFVLWDSSMTEKDVNSQDVFYRQSLISGQRVPVLFDMGGGRAAIDRIRKESGAHVGGVTNAAFNPKFKNTTVEFGQKKYNAACWTERNDVKMATQNPGFGGQKSWHPGNWVHQATARKISLVVLHALDEAFVVWEKAIAEDGGNPIDGKHWHLQAEEDAIRNKLLNAPNTTGCGKLLAFIPRICTTPMRGAEEWSPHVDPDRTSIRALAKPSPTGYVPILVNDKEQAYPGRDPKMPGQRVPMGEVDVATIARSLPPPDSGSERRRRALLERQRQQQRYVAAATNKGTLLQERERVQSQRSHTHPSRQLEGTSESKIIPGEGWSAEGHPIGYCDGTLNSVCYREKGGNCLMSFHNDGRGNIKGDALSGWLVLQLKDITAGIFMTRAEPYHQYKTNKRTNGWTEVNNGRNDTRRLKAPPPPQLGEFEVAINGEIIRSYNKTNFPGPGRSGWIGYNNGFYVLWNDEEWAKQNKKEDVEFAFRIKGNDGRNALMTFTHIYYA